MIKKIQTWIYFLYKSTFFTVALSIVIAKSMNQFFNESICELSSSRSASNISSTNSFTKGFVDCMSNIIGEEWETHMLEHRDWREE